MPYNPETGLWENTRNPGTRYTPVPTFGVPGSGRPGGQTGAGSQTAPAPDAVTNPGLTYASMIQSDPSYQQTLADLGAQNVGDRAGLKSARQRAVIQFGEVPEFSTLDQGALGSDFAEDIDPVTRELALKNTSEGLSVAARINRQHEQNQRLISNYLASRGLLRSGEFGHRQAEEGLAFKTGQYDARQKLLEFLQNFATGYAQGIQRRAAEQRAAAGGAADRAVTILGGTNVGGGGGGAPAAPAATPPARPPVTTPVADQATFQNPYWVYQGQARGV